MVCDIIANGALLPDEARYAISPDDEKDWLIREQETQIAVMREAVRYVEGELLARQYAAGEAGIYRKELERIESALTPDTGKRVVGVAWLREVRAVLLALLDDADSRGVYPNDAAIGDIIDKLAALIGEETGY